MRKKKLASLFWKYISCMKRCPLYTDYATGKADKHRFVVSNYILSACVPYA